MIIRKERIKTGFYIFFLVLFFNTPELRAEAIEGNIDDIARAILTYFPKITGKVSAINDGIIEVDLESGQGLAEGILLTVFREGETFRHPVTDVPLGRFERKVGTIEVIRFEPPLLTAKRVKAQKKIEVGDLVRLPSTKIPLAISTHSEKDHVFLQNELAAALSDTGRFQVDALSPGTDFKTAFTRKNHYHIQLVTRRNEGIFSIQLQIQNTITGKALANIEVLIHQSEDSDLILEHLQYQLFEQRQQNQ